MTQGLNLLNFGYKNHGVALKPLSLSEQFQLLSVD